MNTMNMIYWTLLTTGQFFFHTGGSQTAGFSSPLSPQILPPCSSQVVVHVDLYVDFTDGKDLLVRMIILVEL